MSRAEKFIDEHTKYCSNLAHFEELNGNVWEENTPWLTPDQARKAVEIAKEEVIEDLEKAAVEAFKQIVDSDKNNFLEIFKAGAKWQKEKMMAKAIDGEIGYWNIRGLSINVDLPRTLKEDDRVKLIIIKED